MLIVTSNIQRVQRDLGDIARDQVPFATAVALTRTATDIEKALRQSLLAVFDKPTPYIERGTFRTSAKKDRLEVIIGMRDQATRGASPALYVREHFTGRARGLKPFEKSLQAAGLLPEGYRAVPGQALKLDRFGNPNRATVREVIGAAKSGLSVVGRGKAPKAISYFVVMPSMSNPRTKHLIPGMYRRVGRDALIPVFVYVREASYQRVIDLPKLAQVSFDDTFRPNFAAALQQAIATRRVP